MRAETEQQQLKIAIKLCWLFVGHILTLSSRCSDSAFCGFIILASADNENVLNTSATCPRDLSQPGDSWH